jgi:hypothetical protein
MTHRAIKIITGTMILGLALTGCSSSSQTSLEGDTPEQVQALGGSCQSVMRYLNKAVIALGGAGETTTIDDLLPILQNSGEMLTGGFGSEDLGGMANYNLVNGAGKDLLRMRVDLVEGNDPSEDSTSFLNGYNTIKEMCPGF